METGANNIDLVTKTDTEGIDEEEKAMKLFGLEDNSKWKTKKKKSI